MTHPETSIRFPPFVGQWLSRVTVGANGGGMVTTGLNPPFYPADPAHGCLTSIDVHGNGSVDLHNWKLTGQFAGDHKQIYFGTWTDDEFGGRTGEFCLLATTDPSTGEPMFIGVCKNDPKPGSSSGEWQAWVGTHKR